MKDVLIKLGQSKNVIQGDLIKLKLGKVIGTVVATIKDPGLEGLRLLIIQGLDDNHQPIGSPYVAADGIRTAGRGDIVYLVSKKEAAIVISTKGLIPIDECVAGYIDEYEVVKAAKLKKKVSEKKKSKKPSKTIPKAPTPKKAKKKRKSTKKRTK
ncbi:MAG: EutN/CcmL family microcompartment protein [Candidatus Hodarchaeales archaeon]|jgi:ethanolamine utilization protein EutN